MKNPLVPLVACAALAACARSAREVPDPEPIPALLPAATRPRPVVVSDPRWRPVRTCVVRDGGLAEVEFEYDMLTGDSVYQGVPFPQAFPPGPAYAQSAEWYLQNEPIPFGGRFRFIRYRTTDALEIGDLSRVGEYAGVGVYVEVGQEASLEVLYLPVRPGCIFEAYVPITKME